MILTALIVALSFVWLGWETDWLTVRLPVGETYPIGACCQWHCPDSVITDDMKQELIRSWTNLPKEIRWKFEQGLESPLCGWGYAWQYHLFTPEMRVEMNLANVRYNMTFNDPSTIKEVMRVNHISRKQKIALGITY